MNIMGFCKDFNAKGYFDNAKNAKASDRYTHLAMAASRIAVEDGGLDLAAVDKSRFGVVVGSAFGGMDTFEKQVLALDATTPRNRLDVPPARWHQPLPLPLSHQPA